MAQQFQVLKCCFCHTFQVQQTKKSKKWNCKMCGEKQSVLRVFGQGSGFDCRCHVQKLNLLQGEVGQAPVNTLRHAEEPGERGDENTVVKLEENIDWQEQQVGLASRWTKYLDKKCDEQEADADMVLTENQTFHSWRNMTKNPRKRKATSPSPTDIQGTDQKSVTRVAKNIGTFKSRRESVAVDAKSCGGTTDKGLITPAAEELLVHGVNEEPGSRGAVLSKWEKFLLSDQCDNSSGVTDSLQERSVKTHTAPESDGMAASFVGIITPSNRGPEPKQNASLILDQVLNTEHVGVTRIPIGKSRETLGLANPPPKACLLNRLPEEPPPVLSLSPLAASNFKNPYRSHFSTGDDFDDYL